MLNQKVFRSLTTCFSAMYKLIFTTLLFIVTSFTFAQSVAPQFTYQGRAMNSSGTAPLTGNLTIISEIYNPSSNCLLYSEHQSVTTTDGLFSIQIGSSTGSAKRNSSYGAYPNDPGLELKDVFKNLGVVRNAGTNCAAGYTANATDTRTLKVYISDGVATTTLPDQTLTPVPQAINAGALDGIGSVGFVQTWANTASRPLNPQANLIGFNQDTKQFERWTGATWIHLTPSFNDNVLNGTATANDVMRWNGTQWVAAGVGTVLGSASGDVSGSWPSLTVTRIQGSPISATPPTTGQVLKWNGTAWAPATDAGGLSSTLQSGRVYVGDSSNVATATALSGDATLSNTGVVTVVGLRGGNLDSTLSSLAVGDANKYLKWDGTKWIADTVVSGSGDITDVIAGAGLTGGATTGSATLNIGAGTGITVNADDISLNTTYLDTNYLRRDGTTPLTGNWGVGGFDITNIGYMTQANNKYFGLSKLTNAQQTTLETTLDSSPAAYKGTLWFNADTNQIMYYDGTDPVAVGSGSGGETNTASNLGVAAGTNEGIFASKTGVDLQFKRLQEGTGITLSSDADYITIASSSSPVPAGTTTSSILRWNGSAWVEETDVLVDASGNVTINGTLRFDAGQTVDAISTSTTLDGVSAANTTLPTQLAVKTYIESLVNAVEGLPAGSGTGSMLYWDGTDWAQTAAPNLVDDNQILKWNKTTSQWEVGLDAGASGSGETNTGSSLGGTAAVFKQKTGANLEFRGLTAGTGISVTQNANDITIAATGGGITSIDGSTGTTLTVTDDTNVTVTGGAGNLAINWAGLLSLARGGTNKNMTPINGGIVYTDADSMEVTAAGTSGQILRSNGAAAPTWVNANTIIPVNNGTQNGQLLRWDGSAWQPITLTSGQIIVGNGSSVATPVAVSGDATLSNAGVLTIASNAVTTTKINNGAVTYDKIQNVTTNNRLLGRATTGAGVVEEITLGTGLSLTGTTLNVSGSSDVRIGASNSMYVGSSSGPGTHTSGADGNTAIGVAALDSLNNASADENTALGYNALTSLTSGSGNTAVGNSALLSNTTGGSNTALGVFAGASSSASFNSTVIGYSAMTNASDITSSVSLGAYAFEFGTSSLNNIGVGFRAGRNIATGSSNVIVGTEAASAMNGASSGNIVIGDGAGPSGAAAAYSNKLYINNSQSNFPLIGGDFSTKLVELFGNVEIKPSSSTGSPQDLRFYEDGDNGSNYVGFRAPANVGANVTWTLPSADGTSNQVLTTNGSGVLSWATVSGGAGGETNTASNLGVAAGTNEGIFASKTGVDLQFKRLQEGTGITLSSDADYITIASSSSPVPAGTTTSSILRWNGSAWVEETDVLVDASGNITINGTLRFDAGQTVDAISTSTTLDGVSAANTRLPTQLAVKTYVDAAVTAGDDVDAGSASGQMLRWNGTRWVPITITSGQIIVGNGSSVATPVAVSGDATLSNAGVLTIASNAVTTTKINNGAVTATKLNQMGATTGQVLKWNGTAWAPAADTGLTAAITSLNGLTAATQTFATPGTSGTAPNWSSATSTHTLNIPLAATTGVTAGLISKTQYDTFNAKIGGSGTTNTIPKFTAAGTIGNSGITDSGTIVSLGGKQAFQYDDNYLRLNNNNQFIMGVSTPGSFFASGFRATQVGIIDDFEWNNGMFYAEGSSMHNPKIGFHIPGITAGTLNLNEDGNFAFWANGGGSYSPVHVGTPSATTHAATKAYVDAAVAAASGGSVTLYFHNRTRDTTHDGLGGNTLTGVTVPVGSKFFCAVIGSSTEFTASTTNVAVILSNTDIPRVVSSISGARIANFSTHIRGPASGVSSAIGLLASFGSGTIFNNFSGSGGDLSCNANGPALVNCAINPSTGEILYKKACSDFTAPTSAWDVAAVVGVWN